MDFLKDWQFYAWLLSMIGTCTVISFQWFSHNKIVGNDLHHLSADVKAIAENQDKLDGKVDKLAEDVSYLKGRQDIRQKTYTKKKLRTK